MSKYNWPELLQAQLESGLDIKVFCQVNKLARSAFYLARSQAQKRTSGAAARVRPSGLIPIRVAAGPVALAQSITITLSLDARVLRLQGSAIDLAQLLQCLLSPRTSIEPPTDRVNRATYSFAGGSNMLQILALFWCVYGGCFCSGFGLGLSI